MSEFHSLASLIKRLEVATTRLEDLAMSASSASAVAASSSNNQSSAAGPPPPPPLQPPPQGAQEESVTVQKFDEAIQPLLQKFVAISNEMGGAVANQAALVNEAFGAEKTIVALSGKVKKPDMGSASFMKLIEPIQKALLAIGEIKDQGRGDPHFNNLSVVAEGIPALGWFTVEPTPVPFIRDMKDAAQFYSNRVIKEWKDKDPKQVEWSQTFLAILETLGGYVKENYPTGLTWNAQGQALDAIIDQQSAAAPAAPPAPPAPSAGGPPPPPPPPPPMVIDEATESKPTGAAAVFAEINKGSSITSGLRKVDKSEMTHKNPDLRGNTDKPIKKQGPPTPNKPDKYVLKKPAKTTLEANKWVVENHENNHEIIIEDTAINQAVYIYGCKNSTICIKGKVNAVTMDSCTKCGVAIDSTVSTVDLVNCRSFGLQVFHVTPTIAVDKCDSGSIYLSKECLDVEILSAKSSSVNVLLPEDIGEGETDFKELPVPEQFKTTVSNGKLVTTTVEHAG